jgi:bilirubin oxidase
MGYNGDFLGPTLIMTKGDSLTLNVTNNMSVTTTTHWHGFHVPARYDGGPHQIIQPSDTWSPTFRVLNRAGTYWYHPHGDGQTERQVSNGLAGVIIIRDSAEGSYVLPRTYGVDDFPLIVQTKAFDVLYQFAIANHEDSVVMVNGTMDAYLDVPAQVVRFRLLNGSSDRTFNFGLSDNDSFHVIATDGGLLAQPVAVNRLVVTNGERAEVLIDFGNRGIGDSLFLVSYSSELPQGIIGADSVGTGPIQITEGYYDNPLNGADFSVLRFNVVDSTSTPVRIIPAAFSPVPTFDQGAVSAIRSILFSADTALSGPQGLVDGPFLMNDVGFHMDSVNITVSLDDVEIWVLTNETMVAHPFHIHDVQFRVLDINGQPPLPVIDGLKDLILVEPGDVVRFITRFTTYADNHVPYMFHCHLLHHEDHGMMGAFIVFDSTMMLADGPEVIAPIAYPNPTSGLVHMTTHSHGGSMPFWVVDLTGRTVMHGLAPTSNGTCVVDISALKRGAYLVRTLAEDAALTAIVLKQ